MEVILLLIRLFLAAIFALAGIGKLLDLKARKKRSKISACPKIWQNLSGCFAGRGNCYRVFAFVRSTTSWFGAIGAIFTSVDFYRRNDLADGAGQCAGLSLFRADSQRTGVSERV